MLYRYSRWDGTQNPDAFDADDVLEHVADELWQGGDLRSVLRRMMQRGAQFPSGRRMMGLQELIERLRARQEQHLSRYNLDSILDDVKERLERVVQKERGTLERRLGDADQPADSDSQQERPAREEAPSESGDDPLRRALEGMVRRRLDELDRLPPDPGGRIQGLRDYDFMDQEARQEFQELLDMLRRQVMQRYFQGLQQGIQSLTPEALRRIQQMVQDLNRLLQQRMNGEEPDFNEFMRRWGDLFPDGIKNVDQLAEHLQRQMEQMQALLNSMTPEMRRELEQLMASVLQDSRLQVDLARLAANLQRLFPDRGEPGGFPFSGDEPVTMQEALDLMGDMHRMDDLERELLDAVRSNDPSRVDAEQLGDVLGEEARRMMDQMQQLTKMLEEAGLIQRRGRGWELTAHAIRRIGRRALQEIFGKLRQSALGNHELEQRGSGAERLDETRPYQFGDVFVVDTQRTVMNALRRNGTGVPVALKPDDFEVYGTSAQTQCATVILLDMSYSMMMAGRFQAGQRVALALDTLIRSQFPRDVLHVFAFSYFVLPLRAEMLLDSYWVEYGGGTNFQEALRQARLVLSRYKSTTRQVLMVTDGEPSTYSYWSGRYAEDDWDESGRFPGAMEETLREAVRCARDGVTLNLFMMEQHPSPSAFVRLLARVSRGRAFYSSVDRLGEYVLLDYVANKRMRIR